MSTNEEFLIWQQGLPAEITADALWHATAYRMALFAFDRSPRDIDRIAADPRIHFMADQLSRALGSISATYAEAYSRSSIADRCRFYEYSLGSVRESRDWYFKARLVVGEERFREALEILTRIAQLLTVTIVRERARKPPGRQKGKDV